MDVQGKSKRYFQAIWCFTAYSFMIQDKLCLCLLHIETVSLNSIYFQISIYTWQHTSIQIHGTVGDLIALYNSVTKAVRRN